MSNMVFIDVLIIDVFIIIQIQVQYISSKIYKINHMKVSNKKNKKTYSQNR